MGQVRHNSATTTEAVRRATQNRQASIRALAKQHGINRKAVAKWKKRAHTYSRCAKGSQAKSVKGVEPPGRGTLRSFL